MLEASPFSPPRIGVTPSRPFSIDAVVAPLPVQLRQSMARDAFLRILAFECAPHCRAVAEEFTRGVSAHSDLAPREAARIKLLCRLPPSRRLSSSYLYPRKWRKRQIPLSFFHPSPHLPSLLISSHLSLA